MAPVMHEFVHVHAVENRHGAFLDADEVHCEEQQQPGEDCPWEEFHAPE